MSEARDFANLVASQLDELASQKTKQLVKASAETHDRLAGAIQGLEYAANLVRATVKTFHKQGDENESDGDLESARRAHATAAAPARGRRYG